MNMFIVVCQEYYYRSCVISSLLLYYKRLSKLFFSDVSTFYELAHSPYSSYRAHDWSKIRVIYFVEFQKNSSGGGKWSLTDIADHSQLSSPATQLTILTSTKLTPFLDWTHPVLLKSLFEV